MLCLIWQQNSGNSYSIHYRVFSFQAHKLGIFPDKAHVKRSIMGNHNTALGKLQKLWQYLFDFRRIHNIFVTDACQLLYFVRNGLFGIDKGGKSVGNLSVLNLYCTDFNNPVLYRRKSCGLKVENYIILV